MQSKLFTREPVENRATLPFSEEAAQNALRFHRTIPAYDETPLVSLQCAAKRYNVDSVFVKDESFRFGLKAFKGLGGSYCMFRILCEKLGLDPGLRQISNSGGIGKYPQARFDAVRCGALIYGYNTAMDAKLPVDPVMEWKTAVTVIRRIDKGDAV